MSPCWLQCPAGGNVLHVSSVLWGEGSSSLGSLYRDQTSFVSLIRFPAIDTSDDRQGGRTEEWALLWFRDDHFSNLNTYLYLFCSTSCLFSFDLLHPRHQFIKQNPCLVSGHKSLLLIKLIQQTFTKCSPWTWGTGSVHSFVRSNFTV